MHIVGMKSANSAAGTVPNSQPKARSRSAYSVNGRFVRRHDPDDLLRVLSLVVHVQVEYRHAIFVEDRAPVRQR